MDPDFERCFRVMIKYEQRLRVYFFDCLNASGIHRAVYEGDFPKVERWIESGGYVNMTENSYGFSALHLAVMRNNVEILEYLLTRDGIVVDCTCSHGRTPLHVAGALGRMELVERLIQAGADINITDNNNDTVLHMSVRHPDVCHLLIRLGAAIDTFNSMGRTLLDIAVEKDCLETIHMLLYYNVDVNIVDKRSTPFEMSFRYGSDEAQWALLEYVDDFNMIHYDCLMFTTALHVALQRNSPLIKELIDRGADINYGDEGGGSDESAFAACLRCPVDLSTFKLIWEKLRYNYSKCTIDLLRFLDYGGTVPRFLQVIIDSDNFELVIKCFSTADNYFLFVNKFAQNKFDLDQLTALTCRLLEYGFRASSFDIHAIFSHYGYCELFRILLYMDNDFSRGWLPRMSLPRLLFDIDYNLESVANQINNIPKESVLQLLEYYIYPRLIDALTLQYSEDESMNAILSNLPRVPLLIELARDAARKQIWQGFKVTNTCQFYTIINYLNIPTVCKTILTFRKKIYSIK